MVGVKTGNQDEIMLVTVESELRRGGGETKWVRSRQNAAGHPPNRSLPEPIAVSPEVVARSERRPHHSSRSPLASAELVPAARWRIEEDSNALCRKRREFWSCHGSIFWRNTRIRRRYLEVFGQSHRLNCSGFAAVARNSSIELFRINLQPDWARPTFLTRNFQLSRFF